jgi:predicted DNA-binding antitoxin AbrB/MazE fold protein
LGTALALALEEEAMTLTVDAVYENGVLKPTQPLPLKEHERVRLAILTEASRAQQTYGLIEWSGDAATFERLLKEAELDYLEESRSSRTSSPGIPCSWMPTSLCITSAPTPFSARPATN